MNEIVRDGGYKSRKLWYSIFCIVVIFVAAIIAAKWTAFGAFYGTLTSGVLGLAGLYLTGSVATKWVGSKVPPTATVQTYSTYQEETIQPPAPRFEE